MLKRLNSSDTKNLSSVRFVFMSYRSDICVQFVSARHKDLIGKLMKRIRVKPWTKSGLIGFIVRVYATAGEEYPRGEKAWQFNWQFAVGSGNHRRTVPCYCSFGKAPNCPGQQRSQKNSSHKLICNDSFQKDFISLTRLCPTGKLDMQNFGFYIITALSRSKFRKNNL